MPKILAEEHRYVILYRIPPFHIGKSFAVEKFRSVFLIKRCYDWYTNTNDDFFGQYFFLDKFIGWRCFPSKIQPRFVPWNNYCLQSLEQYMIQKGYITDGVVQKPNINYIELQICRIKVNM